jgi:hypothetical protein
MVLSVTVPLKKRQQLRLYRFRSGQVILMLWWYSRVRWATKRVSADWRARILWESSR